MSAPSLLRPRLAAAALSLGLAGCVLDWDGGDDGRGGGSPGASTTGATSGGPVDQLVCTSTPCNEVCAPGSRCEASCLTGACGISCGSAESCTVSCGADECSVYCEDAGTCDVTCLLGPCNVYGITDGAGPTRLTCNPGASGTLSCDGGNCMVSGALATCSCLDC